MHAYIRNLASLFPVSRALKPSLARGDRYDAQMAMRGGAGACGVVGRVGDTRARAGAEEEWE